MPEKGKRVLITGSSRGIGRGIAWKLAERGARIAVHYWGNEAAARETLVGVRKRGGDGIVLQADVLREEEIRKMFETVRTEFGGLDVFVSNAVRNSLPSISRPWIFRSSNGTRR